MAVHIGPYEVLGRIAVGGMAEVLLGHGPTPGGDDLVAIKVLLPQFAAERDFQEMFLDEARLSALIDHPNVVRIHDLGMAEGRLYLVTEYVRGTTVSVLIRRQTAAGERIPAHLAAAVAVQAAAGLHAAHETRDSRGRFLGLVHRDVSPQNLLVRTDGVLKIVDFGVAKAHYRLSETLTNVVKGKVAYMSPEHARGERVDRRSDVFALGLVVYEMLTGERAVSGEADHDILASLASLVEGRSALAVERPEIPPQLRRVIGRAAQVEPERRYPTAAQMESDLRALLPGSLEERLPELGVLSERHSPRLPSTRSEAKRALEPVYELSLGGDTVRRPVRRLTREQLTFYAMSIAAFALFAGMLLGAALASRSATAYFQAVVTSAPTEDDSVPRGELSVKSLPDGDVEVDGRAYGMTPLRIRVDAGRRLLVVRTRGERKILEARVEVEVNAGTVVQKRFEEAAGRLWDAFELERRKNAGQYPFGPAP